MIKRNKKAKNIFFICWNCENIFIESIFVSERKRKRLTEKWHKNKKNYKSSFIFSTYYVPMKKNMVWNNGMGVAFFQNI